MSASLPLTVYGVNQSFFTRKVTGYLDYKQLPWRLRRGIGPAEDVRAGGWDGGLPAVIDADGEVIWDSTSLILHLEHHHPGARTVLPPDPVHRFLAFVLEDFNDEWLYRPAVGSRWLLPENTSHGSWDLARDAAHELPVPVAQIRQVLTGAMTASLERLGATPENIDSLIDESLKPWLGAMSAHVGEHGYLFGGRPSLADFAFYGGNAAHFVNDPLCWGWVDEVGPEVAEHTFRLTEPQDREFGDWLRSGAVPDSFVELLRQAGRHYLPWVSVATADGRSTIHWESGVSTEIAATNFLTEARGVLLARYVEARSPEIDDVLDAAGILTYFADHVEQATAVPDPAPLPRPADNRPYPAGA
ncbi:MAG TPA: glutathione S-transferase family protein [Acidimicrobiales bacterium]|nr:glutathione S-transferase family protein [Acidimicrobiales bacterium]